MKRGSDSLSSPPQLNREMVPASVLEAFATPNQAQEAVVVSFEAKPLLQTSTGVSPIGSPQSKSGVVLRFMPGITNTWKERTMTVDAANLGVCTFSENSGTLNLKQAHVEVLWAYEEKTGQKFQFSIGEARSNKKEETKDSKESGKQDKNKVMIRVPNLIELDLWITALQSHKCTVSRPIRVGSMMLAKKREESWFVLYPDSLHYFKQRTDRKPTKVVPISEGSVFERLDGDTFCLSETGDDQAVSIECTPPFGEAAQWFEAVESAVRQRLKKKVMQSIREGYLSKCAKNMKFWKKRYFVLMPDHMKYFKKRFDEQHAGIINLPPGAEAEEEDNPADPSLKFLFWVAENGDETGTRRYHMTARNDAERDAWLQTLRTMFAKKNPQVVPLSLKEGYLYKASKSMGTTWSKRYFVLLKDKLIYFRKRNDSAPKGSIDLLQGAEVSMFTDPNINKYPVISVAENGDEEGTRTYYLSAKDPLTRGDWFEMITNLLKTKTPRVNEHSVKEGYMRKQGYGNKWHKRYFVLLEKNLLYYKKRGDRQEAGEIPLPGSAEVMRVDSDDPENKWQFSVAENGDETGTRIYHMSAPSAELRTVWMNHLQKIIKSKDSRIMIGSLLEGYLWKCPEKGGAWRKRYFVLQQNQLLYFRKRADETEAGSVEIKGEAEITLIDDDLEHPYCFTVAKNGDEGERQMKIYAADHIARNEWVNALRHQASLLAVRENPNSIREGYVLHWSTSSWRKRFFTLDKESLSLFVKRKDQKPSLKFPLDKDTVVVLLDDKIPSHGSTWGKHEQLANKQDLPGPPEEKPADDGEGMMDDEKGGTNAAIVLCKNGDADSKNIRLKGVHDGGESLVADLMTVCLSREFPPPDDFMLKSGYLAVRHKANGPFKNDRWIPSFVVLTKERLQFYKSVDDEFPASSCTVDAEAKFYIGPVSGSAVWNALCMTLLDKTDREICATAQSKEEKVSWSNALTRSIMMCKEKLVPTRISLFGAELKASYGLSVLYRMPAVITLCVEFLKASPTSHVMLRFPGFHPLVRSFIQDFELGQEVALTDPDSVAACLKVYLQMLKKPVVPDTTAKAFVDILLKTKKMSQNTVSNNEKIVLHQFQKIISALETETGIALNLLLDYLSYELKRNIEPGLSIDIVISVWAPLLMRYKPVEEETDVDTKAVLGILLRNIDTFFPGGVPIAVRKLPLKKLKALREQCNNLSFDTLYKDRYGMELFRRFAKENYIEEEVKFLSATQQYREMCENPSNAQTQCLAAALLICATYIKQGAETQVNVAATLSNTVLAQFEDPKSAVRSKNLTGNEFADVEAEAVILITTNSYPRFKQSEGFDHWITHREAQAQSGQTKVEDDDAPSLLGYLKKMATDNKEHQESSAAGQEEVKLGPPAKSVATSTTSPATTPLTTSTTSSSTSSNSPTPTITIPPPPPPSTSSPSDVSTPTGLVRTTSVSSVDGSKARSVSFVAAPPPMTNSSDSNQPAIQGDIWFKKKSPSKGVAYYINIATKQTTWKLPETGAIYSCMLDDEGRMYCVNVREKTSSWEVPECLREFVEIYKVV